MDWKLFVLHNGVHYREDIERSVTNSKIYEYVECVERREQTTEVIVADMETFDAALKYGEGKTCAAPNIKASRMIDSKKVQAVISRIKFVLDILEKEACDTVILGAFGCGVFGNDPRSVAKTFRSQGVLHRGFKRVVFAIPNSKSVNHRAFEEVYSDL